MVRDDEIDRLNEQLSTVWDLMTKALKRGDWATYWSCRRSWLALGRLHSLLIQKRADERSAQLTMLPGGAGRAHDKQAG